MKSEAPSSSPCRLSVSGKRSELFKYISMSSSEAEAMEPHSRGSGSCISSGTFRRSGLPSCSESRGGDQITIVIIYGTVFSEEKEVQAINVCAHHLKEEVSTVTMTLQTKGI